MIAEQFLELTGDGHGHHVPGTPMVYRHGWQPLAGPPAPSYYGGRDSKSAHSMADGSYLPERQALHRRIISRALAGHHPELHPVAVFLGGGPGAGKSTVEAKSGDRGVTVDADALMRELPEYRQMNSAHDPLASTFSHREAADIAGELQTAAVHRRVSFTLDGTGDRSYEAQLARADEARAAGYQTVGRYVTTDTDEAVRRSRARAEDPGSDSYGRMVPESAIRAIHATISEMFPRLAENRAFDVTELWDNNGRVPALIGDSGPGMPWQVRDPAAWQRFRSKAGEAGG